MNGILDRGNIMKKLKTIGVLGGMGPSATSDLFQKILTYSQKKYHAAQDWEYPPIVIRSIPLDGFDETGITDEGLVKNQLIEGVVALEQQSAHVIVIPCNTVHCFFKEMQSAVKIPILNIGQKTIARAKNKNIGKIGLLCSDTTRRTHFYQKECIKQNIDAIEPNKMQQENITRVIERVMGGKQDSSDKKILEEISNQYIADGAEAVVLACTEIPLAFSQSDTDITLFDSTQILAESAVDFVM